MKASTALFLVVCVAAGCGSKANEAESPSAQNRDAGADKAPSSPHDSAGPPEDAPAPDTGAADKAPAADSGTPPADAVAAPVDATATADATAMTDATANDDATDAEPLCIDRGEDCRMGTCCAGSTCAFLAELGGKTCVQDCTEHAECPTACCYPLGDGHSVCASDARCRGLPCGKLSLMGSDGTFLGEATSFSAATDGVCNKFGEHGNDFGPQSIFNKFGQYGDDHSPTSAFNKFATAPPRLVCETSGQKKEWVTKSTFQFPRFDPDQLCASLKMMGL